MCKRGNDFVFVHMGLAQTCGFIVSKNKIRSGPVKEDTFCLGNEYYSH